MSSRISKYSFIKNKKYLNRNKILFDKLKVEEYRIWWKGDKDEILTFYKTFRDVNRFNMYANTEERMQSQFKQTPRFYRLVPVTSAIDIGGATSVNSLTIQHVPIATNISKTKADLLAARTPSFSLSSDRDNNEELEDIIESLMSQNKFGSKLKMDIEKASYSGGVAFKPILDQELSDIAFYQSYDNESFILNKVADQLVSIVFMDIYSSSDGKVSYRLFSEYGKGYINYVLTNEETFAEVPFDTIPELKDLKPLVFLDKETKLPIKDILASYVENKPGLLSDYHSILTQFESVDEVQTKWMDFMRNSSITRIVSENSLKKTKNGESITPSAYGSNIIIEYAEGDPDKKVTNEIQQPPEMQNATIAYKEAFTQSLTIIAQSSGLSLRSILGEDSAGANSSEQALLMRHSKDQLTRESMSIEYAEALEHLFKLLLMFTSGELKDDIFYVDPYNDLDLSIEFYNTMKPSFAEEINETRELLESGLIDEKSALDRLWLHSGRKSEEEVNDMYLKIQGKQIEIKEEFNNERNEFGIDAEEDDEDENL